MTEQVTEQPSQQGQEQAAQELTEKTTTKRPSQWETMSLKAFRENMRNEEHTLKNLTRIRNSLAGGMEGEEQQKKLRLVEALMRKKLKEGEKVLKRKAGTGERTVVEMVYRDTPGNRRLERVGKTYSKVSYTNPEMVETRIRIGRRRRAPVENDPEQPDSKKKKKNVWIQAVETAKRELQAPAFVIIRKESPDPNDLGVSIYNRAKAIVHALQQEQPQQQQEQVA